MPVLWRAVGGALCVLVAAVATSGCSAERSAGPSPSASPATRIPTDPEPRDAYAASLLFGTLAVVDPGADPLCTYVGAVDDASYVIWPRGYRADPTGRRILRPDGSVAATVGEEVSLGGGAWALGPAVDDTCPQGPRWMAAPL